MDDMNGEGSPECPNCPGPMSQIGSLPNLQHRRRIVVFRCKSCDHVLSYEDSSTRVDSDARS